MRKVLQAVAFGILAFPMARMAYSACQTLSLTDITKVSKAGDTMIGDLIMSGGDTDIRVGGDVSISNDLNVAGESTFHSSATFYGPVKLPNIIGPTVITSSVNIEGAIRLNNIDGAATFSSSVTINAAAGLLVKGSVTASGYFDLDGNRFTGSSGGGNTIGFITDNFLNKVNGVATSFVMTSTPSAPSSLQVILDGILQSPTSDYTYTSGATFTMSSAPAQNSSSFFVRYTTGTTNVLTDGTNCSAGSYPLGVDSAGNAQSCTVALDATSNNIFTGQNRFTNDTTFTDSVYISAASTIGPQGYVSAVTKTSGTFNNMWMVVASTNPSAQAGIDFTSLTASRRYRLSWSFTKNTAGNLFVRFNSDSGSNYKYAIDGINTNGAAASQGASNSATSCLLNGGGGSVGDGLHSEGTFEFAYKPADTTIVSIHARHTWEDANPFEHSNSISCKYDGSSAVSSLSLNASAGTLTGFAYLEELIVPNP